MMSAPRALVELGESRDNTDGKAQETSHLYGRAEQSFQRLAARILEHQHCPTGVALETP